MTFLKNHGRKNDLSLKINHRVDIYEDVIHTKLLIKISQPPTNQTRLRAVFQLLPRTKLRKYERNKKKEQRLSCTQ